MHLVDHEQHCIKELGKPFTEVHEFLDQFASKYGMSLAHRIILHHRLGVELVGLLMGPEAKAAAKLHVVDDVRRLPAGPEWFMRLPAYVPTSGQVDALAADMLAHLGYAPNLAGTWARMSSKLKCECGYPGPLQSSRSLGYDEKMWCPWCAAVQTERFVTLRQLTVGKSKNRQVVAG
ncbi:hypothetical protein [Fundidesulfovibrio terrae]|uniref:hypothetical protein n=1 Tax=Fundidesulfovibrio terrae TaxID=2922866 RepID=UPI001FAF131A|nr:hypothetical protein [Fundidesulfovibrio terrae]